MIWGLRIEQTKTTQEPGAASINHWFKSDTSQKGLFSLVVQTKQGAQQLAVTAEEEDNRQLLPAYSSVTLGN
jgi:hypothetical protein